MGQRGIETISHTILSCEVKPIKNPVPSREVIVPRAYKAVVIHKLESVNDYAFEFEP